MARALLRTAGGSAQQHRRQPERGQRLQALGKASRPPGHRCGSGRFFLVTEAGDFDALRTLGFNVVLQPVRTADDGSLSVWAARNRVRYFNAEAQHRDCLDYDRARGHLDYQIRMLRALESLL